MKAPLVWTTVGVAATCVILATVWHASGPPPSTNSTQSASARSAVTVEDSKPRAAAPRAAAPRGAGPSASDSRQSLPPAAALKVAAAPNPRDLELVERSKKGWRAQLPGVGEAVGLHPEEVESLLQILAEHELLIQRQPPIKPRPGMTAAEILAYGKKPYEDREAAVASFLGAEKYHEWQDYNGTLNARIQVQRLRQSLESSGSPLGDAQAKLLTDALIQEQKAYAAERKQEAERRGTPRRKDPQAVLRQYERFAQRMHQAAAPYLDAPEQMERFDQMIWDGRPSVDEIER